MGNKSAKALGERPLEKPLSLASPATLIALGSRPERVMGTLEIGGRVIQNDVNKTVVGWIDADGIAYRNDYNRTIVGRVDLGTGEIFSADYNKTNVGRVNEAGQVFFSSSVVHVSGTKSAFGQINGPSESYKFGACALLTLWG